MIRLTDVDPCCFGLAYFIIFGLLTLNAIYSTYLDNFCAKQDFAIKKLISTRKDLREGEFQKQYQPYAPSIMQQNQVVVFSPTQPPQIILATQPAFQQYLIQPAPTTTMFIPITQVQEPVLIQPLPQDPNTVNNTTYTLMQPQPNSSIIQVEPPPLQSTPSIPIPSLPNQMIPSAPTQVQTQPQYMQGGYPVQPYPPGQYQQPQYQQPQY